MLSKKTYREVLRNLDHYRQQHELDRLENPGAIPMGWKSSLVHMIENTVRKNHERYQQGMAENALEYMVKQGLLVAYHGDYTFPGTPVPSKEEIAKEVGKMMKKLDNLH